MRKLKTADLFGFARCIKEIGLKDEIKKIAMEANNTKDIAENGFDYFYILFEKAVEKNSEQAFYNFLAGPLEMKPEDIQDMDPVEFMDAVSKLASWETWKLFFKKALHLT